MKITINKQIALDSRGQLILTGTIEEVNCFTLLVTILQGIKHLKHEISNTENELRKYLLGDLIKDAEEIHKNLVDVISEAMKDGMETELN